MADGPAHVDTIRELLLPCECGANVLIRTDRPSALVNAWLDGLITVHCDQHRARQDNP